MQELDLPRDPCNPDSDYNFYVCVRKYTTKKVRQNIWEFGPRILVDHIVMFFLDSASPNMCLSYVDMSQFLFSITDNEVRIIKIRLTLTDAGLSATITNFTI